MIAGRSAVAVITARGGSKGLAGKNLRKLGGLPLLAWTIRAAHGAKHLDRTVLSSDDDEIIAAAEEAGCEVPFRRPAELARDESSSIDALLHALDRLDQAFDIAVLLQPTSPLRTSADIDACLERLSETNAPACVTVCRAPHPAEYLFRLGADGKLHAVLEAGYTAKRRQDLLPSYQLNGAVYAAETAWLRQHCGFLGPQTVAIEMPANRSIDIDTEFDLRIARMLIAERDSDTPAN